MQVEKPDYVTSQIRGTMSLFYILSVGKLDLMSIL